MEKKISNKKIIILGISLLLVSLIGLSLAGVLEYYGKVVANVNVNPPVFYPTIENGNKVLDTYIPAEGSIDIHVQAPYDSVSLGFRSNKLNVDKWYPSKWNINLIIYTENTSASINLYLYNGSTILGYTRTPISLSRGNNSIIYNFTIDRDIYFMQNDDYLILKIEFRGCGNTYKLYFGSNTKVEVIPLS